ncbi:MAG: PepSY domain-containing protein [Hyphomicrobiaceae bacterium]
MSTMAKFLHRSAAALALAAATLAASDIAVGSDKKPRRDHDLAREALRRGDILPLAKVLAIVRQHVQGDVVEVELEHEHGQLVYELKLLASDGRLIKVYASARDGTIIKTKGK